MKRVYADTNIYGRPFDNQREARINLEAEASLIIFQKVLERKIILTGSDILKVEVDKTSLWKKSKIKSFLTLVTNWVPQTEKLYKLAKKIQKEITLNPADSIHLASAIIGKAKYFIPAMIRS